MPTSVDNRIGYVLKRVQLALRARMDRDLAPYALTASGYAVLSALEARPGLSSASLARRSFVTPQTMVRTVANLAASGLLRRPVQPEAGRILPAELTPKGLQVLASAHQVVEQVEADLVAPLGESERELFLSLLVKVADALAPWAGDRSDAS